MIDLDDATGLGWAAIAAEIEARRHIRHCPACGQLGRPCSAAVGLNLAGRDARRAYQRALARPTSL